jgi:hypothetical protein
MKNDKVTHRVTDKIKIPRLHEGIHITVSHHEVLIDGQLNMSDHAASVYRSCYFQLRQSRQIKGCHQEPGARDHQQPS